MTYSVLFSSHHLLRLLEPLAIAAVLIALLWPHSVAGWPTRLECYLHRVAQNRRQAILTAALFPMMARALMLPWYPPPPPQIHDEFSYLLQADTFAHGRVANPAPPYWEHFETEYQLLQPVYASQYQPAQGLMLAVGQVLFGHPWWGAWISIGILCGMLCWALGYVVPPAWAFAGALGVGLQFGIFGIWMNSYFGGAVSASAGALVFASLARMKRSPRTASAWCAAGLILLFATRPFEALLWCTVTVWYVVRFTLRTRKAAISFTRLAVPFAAVFALGAGVLAWYNWRITGNPANPPYLAYQRTYGTPQPYWWQPPLTVTQFRFAELRNNYRNQRDLYEERNSVQAIVKSERNRLANFWRFFVGPFFTPALLFLPFIFRDRRIRPWLFTSIPFILAKATYHAWYPAHSGPETILIVLVMLACWRHMRVWLRRRGAGLAMSRTLIAGLCAAIVLGGAGRALEPLLAPHFRHLPVLWESLYPAKKMRDDVTRHLESIPGKHLVFMKYEPGHCYCEEFVFNSADIRKQRIVYARLVTQESDEALARYLSDHDVWLMEPDVKPYRLLRTGEAGDASAISALR